MQYSPWRRIVCACILSAIPSYVYADHGVVLIDQTRALAGNVTPGDAPGFPVTITQAGTYRLSGNLTVPEKTTAIHISADYVTLDLNGFSIIGPVVCPGRPAKCPAPSDGVGVQSGGDVMLGPRGVRVENGSVRGMGNFGIWLTGDGSSVSRVTVDRNAGGGMHIAGTVLESSAIENGSFGIFAVAVRESSALQNAGDGILLDAGGVATGNVASSNGGFGIFVPFGTATGNTAFINKSFGISASCPSAIVGNTIVTGDHQSLETKGDGCVLANNATRP